MPAVARAEFTVLKAAASLTAAVLEFEKPNPTLAIRRLRQLAAQPDP